ncbi:MAG: hypothetical protein JST36_07135 [Bacteroidetes bacterium]|nr:hypothetical protein [Bacteroidota bacterium]
MRHLLILLLIIASTSVLIGVTLKVVQHWPIGNVFIGAGLLTELVCAVLLIRLSLKNRKQQ